MTRDEAIKAMRDEGRECRDSDGSRWKLNDEIWEFETMPGKWVSAHINNIMHPNSDDGWELVPRKRRVESVRWAIRDAYVAMSMVYDSKEAADTAAARYCPARTVTQMTMVYEVDE